MKDFFFVRFSRTIRPTNPQCEGYIYVCPCTVRERCDRCRQFLMESSASHAISMLRQRDRGKESDEGIRWGEIQRFTMNALRTRLIPFLTLSRYSSVAFVFSNRYLRIRTHIAQNIAETCQKYFQSFITIEMRPQRFCQLFQNISLQHYNFSFLKYFCK